jgi:UDP-N-acetylmuramyl pentapeptide synthase
VTPRWHELSELVRTSPGRLEIRRRLSFPLWPLSSRLARLHRRTLARRTRLVVVVGSVGKTTTARAVAAALGLRVRRLTLLNANSYSAVAGAVLHIRPWQRRAVLEAGIAVPGEMGAYADVVRPDVVVVTSIASDHRRSFASLEATRAEKVKMVRALAADGVAVLNADDPNVRWMAGETRARVVLFGRGADAAVRATDVALDWPHGTRFLLHAAGTTRAVRVRLIGEHMVHPALAALAVALTEGQDLDATIRAVSALEPTPGRMMPVVLPGGAVVLRDDFKGSLETFHAALDVLAALPARRRIAVLGEMSESPPREYAVYRELGARVAAVAERAVFIGRKFRRYRPGAVGGGLAEDRVVRARDVHEAIALLRQDLGPGDVVLLKGRWQQRLARIAFALAGREVRCRADPCPFRRMLCDLCPLLERPFGGLSRIQGLGASGRDPPP